MISNMPSDYAFKIMEHLSLSMGALAMGILIAIPFGIVISSHKKLTQWVIGVSSVLQTIPSMALLAMMVPILGVGKFPAIIALFIYSLMPILRNTVLGMQSVDVDLVDAAKGMGFTQVQIYHKVKLPMAFGVMMSGVRLAAVYVLAWASLASYIGAGGLGDYIFSGMNNYDISLIVYGTLPIMVLGLCVDFLFSQVEKWLSPKTSSQGVKS